MPETSSPAASTKSPTRQILRRQFTLGLFLSQIELEPSEPFVAYVSVVVTKMKLVTLWDEGRLFYGSCTHPECGNLVYANAPTTTHARACLRQYKDAKEEENMDIHLKFNPQLLGGMADEDAGFLIDDNLELVSHAMSRSADKSGQKKVAEQQHNLELTSRAIYGLTGLTMADFSYRMHACEHSRGRSAFYDVDDMSKYEVSLSRDDRLQTDQMLRTRLQYVEDLLLWTRLTLMLGWTGEKEDGSKKGDVVVLQVIS